MKKYIVIEKATKETKPYLFDSHDDAVQYIFDYINEHVIAEINIDVDGLLYKAQLEDGL